jgi:hypothetical protein
VHIVHYCCPIVNKFGICVHILVKIPNIKLNESPFKDRRTTRQTCEFNTCIFATFSYATKKVIQLLSKNMCTFSTFLRVIKTSNKFRTHVNGFEVRYGFNKENVYVH